MRENKEAVRSSAATSIIVRNACKRYQQVNALDQASCSITCGCFFLLLGPNGAGKSTLLKTIAGLESLDSGEVIFPAMTRIGYVPQRVQLGNYLTARNLLELAGTLYNLQSKDIAHRIDELAELLGLERLDDFPNNYSGGMQKRLLFAISLIHQPEVLLLDEAMEGLDFMAQKRILSYLKKLTSQRRTTVIMATHIPDLYEGSYDEAAIFAAGKPVWCSNGQKMNRQITGPLSEVYTHYV